MLMHATPHAAVSRSNAMNMKRVIDLEVDIGADAVDYKYVIKNLGKFLY